jgi:glucan 1,3-beta-glucosidase
MSMFKQVLGFFALAGVFATEGFSLAGTLTAANNNWTGAVEVTGNIIVPAGLTLTVNPGARVRSVGGKYSITANGPVKAVGNLAGYIDFYDVAIVLNNAGAQHDFQYCVLLNDQTSAIAVTGADARFSHLQIQDFGTTGINITGAGAKAILQFCTIGAKSRLFGGTNAVSVAIGGGADAADIDISNSILGFENKAIQTGLTIKTSGGAAATSATVKVRYSLITGTRVGSGVETGVLTGIDSDVKDIPNLDYHLWPYSAAINAGDPASDFSAEPAPNGGRVDMGYYGGTAEASPFHFLIVKPNGGDSLTPGKVAEIKWQGGKLLGAKKIDLSIDSGKTWQAVSASVDAGGLGTYSWTVPQVKSPNCFVRISLPAGEGLDVSDRVFTIGDTVAKGGNGGVLKDPTFFRCIPFSAYRDGQAPGQSEPTDAQVKADLQLIKPYTREIRTYGSGSTTHGNKLPAMCDELGMKIHLGIWIDDTYPEGTNLQSINEGIALAKENHPSIKTIIVGNEFLLRVRQAHRDEHAAEAKLVRYIKLVKAAVPAHLVVSTGESYPDWLAASDELVKAVDKVIWHVHPWWEQKSIDNAANHAFNVYNQMKTRIAKVPGGKSMVLGETGWPSAATTGAAVGSPENQARYLKDLHAWAKKAGLDYWFFTNVDEKWKGNEGVVGANWGMHYSDRTPKYILGHLPELIPADTRWENDITTGIARPIASVRSAGFPGTGLFVYDLQGRLIGAVSRGNGDDRSMLGKARKTAQGFHLTDKRLR